MPRRTRLPPFQHVAILLSRVYSPLSRHGNKTAGGVTMQRPASGRSAATIHWPGVIWPAAFAVAVLLDGQLGGGPATGA